MCVMVCAMAGRMPVMIAWPPSMWTERPIPGELLGGAGVDDVDARQIQDCEACVRARDLGQELLGDLCGSAGVQQPDDRQRQHAVPDLDDGGLDALQHGLLLLNLLQRGLQLGLLARALGDLDLEPCEGLPEVLAGRMTLVDETPHSSLRRDLRRRGDELVIGVVLRRERDLLRPAGHAQDSAREAGALAGHHRAAPADAERPLIEHLPLIVDAKHDALLRAIERVDGPSAPARRAGDGRHPRHALVEAGRAADDLPVTFHTTRLQAQVEALGADHLLQAEHQAGSRRRQPHADGRNPSPQIQTLLEVPFDAKSRRNIDIRVLVDGHERSCSLVRRRRWPSFHVVGCRPYSQDAMTAGSRGRAGCDSSDALIRPRPARTRRDR